VTPTCHSFDGKTSEAALAYLQQERSILEPAGLLELTISVEAPG
jgi:hypothetical protein